MSDNSEEIQKLTMQCIESYISELPKVTQTSLLGMIELYARLRVDAFAAENRDE